MLTWCKVEEMQNSAVSFLTYSFSDSFFLRFRNSLTAYNFSSLRSHLCASRTTDVAPLPIANFWHTPYFFDKLAVLPPFDFASPPSESDRLLLPTDRPDDLRTSLGPLERRSLRLNLWLLPSVEATDGALPRAVVGDFGGSEAGITAFGGAVAGCSFLVVAVVVVTLAGVGATFSPEILGALLCRRLGAWLGGLLEAALVHSLSEGDDDSRTDDGAEPKVEVERCLLSIGGPASTSFSRARRVWPGSLGNAPDSGEGSGMLVESFVIKSAVFTVPSTRPFGVGMGLGAAMRGRGVWSSCGGLSELSGPSPSVCEDSESASVTVIVNGERRGLDGRMKMNWGVAVAGWWWGSRVLLGPHDEQTRLRIIDKIVKASERGEWG